MRPGDYVIFPTGDNVTYVWKISGIYYGALGHEDVVGLQPVIRNPAVAHGVDVLEMLVPLPLIQDHVFANNRHGSGLRGAVHPESAQP